ncbi:MAG: PGPGW domain-containing protein [Thermodesulfobacteriota bacterium]
MGSLLPQALLDAIHTNETLLWWLAGSSLLTFIASLLLIPFLLTRLPVDYFAHGKRHRPPWAHHHPVVRFFLLLSKNILGVVFLLAGFLMLFLPGQGLLTMVMGVVLLDLPGKYKLERWLVARPAILKSINWLRQRSGHPQFTLYQDIEG